MNKLVLILVLSITVIGMHSCASQYPMLYKKASMAADEYKKHCKLKELQSGIVAQGDSLYSASVQLMQNGKDQEGYFLMEMTAIYYRLALSQNEVTESKEEIKKLEHSLIKAKDKLDTYKKVLSELESIKK